jgi:hypothetical protein
MRLVDHARSKLHKLLEHQLHILAIGARDEDRIACIEQGNVQRVADDHAGHGLALLDYGIGALGCYRLNSSQPAKPKM